MLSYLVTESESWKKKEIDYRLKKNLCFYKYIHINIYLYVTDTFYSIYQEVLGRLKCANNNNMKKPTKKTSLSLEGADKKNGPVGASCDLQLLLSVFVLFFFDEKTKKARRPDSDQILFLFMISAIFLPALVQNIFVCLFVCFAKLKWASSSELAATSRGDSCLGPPPFLACRKCWMLVFEANG